MVGAMRQLLIHIALLSLPMASVAHAQTAQPPASQLAGDRLQIATCLRQVQAGWAACLGSVAVPCVRAATGDRRDAEVACARREQRVWRERLALASRTLLGTLEPGARTRFVALQLAWESYSAQKCAFMASTQPPARSAGAQAGCDLREAGLRALEIERGAVPRQGPRRPAQSPPAIIR